MPSLVISLAGKLQASRAIDRPCMRIGRSTANDIVLESRKVSSAHALISLSGDKLAIEDLGSTNGTFLGGTRIERADLDDGSVICIGDYALKLVADRKAMAYEPTMLVRSGATAKKAYLQRLDGLHAGELIELGKVVNTVGQPGECMVTLIRRGDDFAVRFAGGPRPRLNGAELADAPARLNAGDVLEMGTGRLQFHFQEASARVRQPTEQSKSLANVLPAPEPKSWLRRFAPWTSGFEREKRSRQFIAPSP